MDTSCQSRFAALVAAVPHGLNTEHQPNKEDQRVAHPHFKHVDSDGNERDGDGIPDDLQQHHVCHGTLVQYGAPVQLERRVNCAAQVSR